MNNIINFITQHTILTISFIIIIMGYIAFELFMWLSGGAIEHKCKVSVHQLVMLFNHNNALIVDIRSEDSYKAGHIIDSVNIPENAFSIHHKLIKSTNSHRPIVLVCEHGRNSAQIAVNLRKENVKEAFFLEGGFMAWRSAGIPIYSEHNKILKNNGKKIVIYTKDSCPYSVSAKNLLRSKGYHYKEIKIHNNSVEFSEMVQLSDGRKTVPQIFINGKHIGGFEDLKALDDRAEL